MCMFIFSDRVVFSTGGLACDFGSEQSSREGQAMLSELLHYTHPPTSSSRYNHHTYYVYQIQKLACQLLMYGYLLYLLSRWNQVISVRC